MFSTIEDLTGQLKPLSVYVKLLQRKIMYVSLTNPARV